MRTFLQYLENITVKPKSSAPPPSSSSHSLIKLLEEIRANLAAQNSPSSYDSINKALRISNNIYRSSGNDKSVRKLPREEIYRWTTTNKFSANGWTAQQFDAFPGWAVAPD